MLGAIKPKFVAYLEGIDYRLKLLEETPRVRANDGNINVMVRGFLKEYVPSKSYQKQKATEIQINLLMDAGLCKLYGNCSKEVAQNMNASDPTHNEENLQALLTLAVMELQFMHGCDVDWNARNDGAALSSGEDDASDSSGGGGIEADGDSENVDSADQELLDFASIDSTDVLSDEVWKDLDYPNPDEFVKCKESFALAILMFLSEELSCKYPKLSGQVHAGWKSAFGGPVSFDQLIDRPDKISTMFTEEEEEWFSATIEHFVSTKTAEQLEELGITDEQLERFGISKPNPPAAAGARQGVRVRVKSTPFLFRSTSGANLVLTYVRCCRAGGKRLKAGRKHRGKAMRRQRVLNLEPVPVRSGREKRSSFPPPATAAARLHAARPPVAARGWADARPAGRRVGVLRGGARLRWREGERRTFLVRC